MAHSHQPLTTDPESTVPPIPQLMARSGLELGEETCTVLHVDDDPALLELSEDYLTQLQDDFAVVTETSASAGVDRLATDEIHAIVSDYEMPGMNGLEFLEVVRAEHPELPFILFTGKGSEEIASEAIASGVTDYLQKGGGTDRYEVLANRVVNALDQYFTMEDLWTTLTSFSRLVEQDLVGVYLIQDGEFRYVNQRLAEIFGYRQQALFGESIETLVSDDDIELVRKNLEQRVSCDSEKIKYQFTGKTKGGATRRVTVSGGVIDLHGEPAIIGTLLPSTDLGGAQQ